MIVYRDYNEAKSGSPYCIALGSFDGLHLGHQKLIEMAINKSRELKCKSMVYTFRKHPRKVLMPEFSTEIITENAMRINIMKSMGLDAVYLEDFSRIMKMDAETFIKEILISKFNVKCIVVGYNYTFGNNKKGNTEVLKHYGNIYGFDVLVVDAVTIENNIVSSSLIRKMIKEGKVDAVKAYLGRDYSISGKVIHGKKNGQKLGVRTANAKIDSDIVIPKPGVYLTNTIVNNKVYKSVTNVGNNPTFNGNGISIETHLLNFEGNLYDEDIEIVFLKWKREEKTFKNIEELKSQIFNDINYRLEYK